MLHVLKSAGCVAQPRGSFSTTRLSMKQPTRTATVDSTLTIVSIPRYGRSNSAGGRIDNRLFSAQNFLDQDLGSSHRGISEGSSPLTAAPCIGGPAGDPISKL